MEQQDGEVFFYNDVHKASQYCSVLIPKQLSLNDFRKFLDQRLPFHVQSTNTENSCLLSFPPEAEMWERTHFDLQKLRQRKINTVDQCSYQKLESGIFQRVEEDPVGTFETLEDYLTGPIVIRNLVVQELIDKKVDIVSSLTRKFESVESKSLTYVNDFNFWSELTRNWFHPFSLAHLESPMATYKSLKHQEGITESWTYFGRPSSSSPLHIDDHSLSSAIYHLYGSTKIWLTIPSGDKLKFESLVEQNMPTVMKPSVVRCDRKLTALKFLFTPKKLEEWGVNYQIIFQNPGEFLMLKSNSYHQVFNLGHNVTQSVNYCDDRYFCLNIHHCKCRPKRHGDTNPFNVRVMKLDWTEYIGNPVNWSDRFEQMLKARHPEPPPSSASSAEATCSSDPVASTSTRAELRKPIKRLESSPADKPIRCEFEGCNKSFQYKSLMNRHYRSFHLKSTRVVCDVCGVGCYDSHSLKRHRAEQGCNDLPLQAPHQ